MRFVRRGQLIKDAIRNVVLFCYRATNALSPPSSIGLISSAAGAFLRMQLPLQCNQARSATGRLVHKRSLEPLPGLEWKVWPEEAWWLSESGDCYPPVVSPLPGHGRGVAPHRPLH